MSLYQWLFLDYLIKAASKERDDCSRGRLASCRHFSRIFLSHGPPKSHRSKSHTVAATSESFSHVIRARKSNEDLITSASRTRFAIKYVQRAGTDETILIYIHIYPYRVLVHARPAFQKHAHFSLVVAHGMHTRMHTRVPVSRGVNSNVTPLPNERASEQVVQPRHLTIRRARTPTADWLLAVVCARWLSRSRASFGACLFPIAPAADALSS